MKVLPLPCKQQDLRVIKMSFIRKVIALFYEQRVLQESMVISASNRAYVKTVLHVIQCLVLAVVQQAGKVSSVNKVGACM